MVTLALVLSRPILLALSLLTLAACGVGAASTPTPTATQPPTADAILDAARTAMANVTSYRWQTDHELHPEGNRSPVPSRLEGAWANGNLDFTLTVPYNPEFERRTLYVNGRAFRPIDGVWKESSFIAHGLPAYDDRSPVPELETASIAATNAGTYTIEGTQHADAIDHSGPIDYTHTVVIDRDTHRLVSTSYDAHHGNGDRTLQTILFTDYNTPAPIEIPTIHTPSPGTPTPQPAP